MYEEMHEKMYEEVFDQTCENVEMMKKKFGVSKTDVEGMLESEYIRDGNNWEGRSEVVELKLNATIAAYEHMLANWD